MYIFLYWYTSGTPAKTKPAKEKKKNNTCERTAQYNTPQNVCISFFSVVQLLLVVSLSIFFSFCVASSPMVEYDCWAGRMRVYFYMYAGTMRATMNNVHVHHTSPVQSPLCFVTIFCRIGCVCVYVVFPCMCMALLVCVCASVYWTAAITRIQRQQELRQKSTVAVAYQLPHQHQFFTYEILHNAGFFSRFLLLVFCAFEIIIGKSFPKILLFFQSNRWCEIIFVCSERRINDGYSRKFHVQITKSSVPFGYTRNSMPCWEWSRVWYSSEQRFVFFSIYYSLSITLSNEIYEYHSMC